MEKVNYTVQIPEPCNENWNSMLPNAEGKFCTSCSKTVVDFSNKTDLEILVILHKKKGENVCGHFRKTQINRPLEIKVDLSQLPKNMSTTKTFTLVLFLVFGSFLFSCKDISGQTLGEMQVSTTTAHALTKGKIKMSEKASQNDSVPSKDSISIKLIEIEPMISGGISYVEMPILEDTLLKTNIAPIHEEQNSNTCFTMGDTSQMFDESDNNALQNGEMEIQETSKIARENNDSVVLLNKQLQSVFIYPNPFKEECFVRYDLLKRSDVRIEIFDANRKLIKKIVDVRGQYEGRYTIPITLAELSNSFYMVQFTIDGKTVSKKLVLEN